LVLAGSIETISLWRADPNGPDRPGTIAELYADQELPDVLVWLMIDSPWWSIGCIDLGDRQGANWHGKPSIVPVTVSWNDRQVVRSYQPAYEEHHMWGMRCDSANITVTIPISP